jgi:putative flippase GtrA
VVRLAMIVLVSALTLMPHTPVAVIAGAVIAIASTGLLYCLYVGREIRKGRLGGHLTDFWSYAVAVASAYAVQLAAGIGLLLGWPESCWILAASFLGQLMIAIYNAWDLVTFLAPRAHHGGPAAD